MSSLPTLIQSAGADYKKCLLECNVPSTVQSRTGAVYSVACLDAEGLSEIQRQEVFSIFEENMRALYEATWGWNQREKLIELFSGNSRYLVLSQDGRIAAYSHFQVVINPVSEEAVIHNTFVNIVLP